MKFAERYKDQIAAEIERGTATDVWIRGTFDSPDEYDDLVTYQGWVHRSGKYGCCVEIHHAFGVEHKEALYRFSVTVLSVGMCAAVVRCLADATRVVEAYEAIGLSEAADECLRLGRCWVDDYAGLDAEMKRIAAAFSGPDKQAVWSAIAWPDEPEHRWVFTGEDYQGDEVQ